MEIVNWGLSSNPDLLEKLPLRSCMSVFTIKGFIDSVLCVIASLMGELLSCMILLIGNSWKLG